MPKEKVVRNILDFSCKAKSKVTPTNLTDEELLEAEIQKRMPCVVKLQKTSTGKVTSKYDIYIGRRVYKGGWTMDASDWRNPFHQFNTKTHEERVEKYRNHVLNNPNLMEKLHTLEGKTLACWCLNSKEIHPIKCHGQILMDLVYNKVKKEVEANRERIIQTAKANQDKKIQQVQPT